MEKAVVRTIIEVSKDLCNGCAQCAVDCSKRALIMESDKASLLQEAYCEGLGTCLAGCPTGALKLIRRAAAPYDFPAVLEHLAQLRSTGEGISPAGWGGPAFCAPPGARMPGARPEAEAACSGDMAADEESEGEGEQKPACNLRTASHWPLKLRLAPVDDPLLHGSDLLIAGDCTAFATRTFHETMSPGKVMLIGCPKFEDARALTAKLVELFQAAKPAGCTAVRMEKPCCKGIHTVCVEAAKATGMELPIREFVVTCSGEVEEN